MNNKKISGITFVVIGIALLLYCTSGYVNNYKIARTCSASANAVITDTGKYLMENNKGGNKQYQTITLEMEVNGQKYSKVENLRSNQFRYSKGQSVEVKYNPANPAEFYYMTNLDIDTSMLMWIAISAFIVIKGIVDLVTCNKLQNWE